jgi:hypothetical protein
MSPIPAGRDWHRADARQRPDRTVSLVPGQQVADDLPPAE